MSVPSGSLAASELSGFRARFPGCELVMLADTAAGTVLAWDGAVKLPQEHLDSLCEAAETLLDDMTGGPGNPESVVRVKQTGCEAFVRAPDGAGMVLCSVFEARADMDGLVEASRAVLARTSGDLMS